MLKKLDLNNLNSITKNNRLDLIDILEDFVYCMEHLDSNKIILKGGIALLSAMSKYNKTTFDRLTTDLDLHCNNIKEWDIFKNSLSEISKYSKLNLNYVCEVTRPISLNNISETLTVYVNDTVGETYMFSIDMNINTCNIQTENYNGRYMTLDFVGYSIETMLSDKLAVFASRKLCRRVKDLHDINSIIHFKNINMCELVSIYKSKHTPLTDTEIYGLSVENIKDIEHAYSKLKGIKNKLDFEEVYGNTINFATAFYHSVITNSNLNLIWDCEKECWCDV